MTNPKRVPVDGNSKLVVEDKKSNNTFAAKKIYERIAASQWEQPDQSKFVKDRTPFEPATSDSDYSYTAARVLKPVFNVYKQNPSKPKIFGYFTDWSQYDGRMNPKEVNGLPNEPVILQDQWEGIECGRGYDLAEVDPRSYDKIVFGFLGIVGDDGEKGHIVNTAAKLLDKKQDEATFMDWWGDIAAWERNGFEGPKDSWKIGAEIPVKDVFNQKAIEADQAWGLLGGLYRLQKKAAGLGHKLELAFSIGGWTMSKPFYGIAADAARRRVFVASVVKIFQDFPMFSEVDCDWEFPGGGGNDPGMGGPEDGENYKHLIGELRAALDSAFGPGAKRISVACSGVVKKMQDSKVTELFGAGLDNVNVMTYDFFGTPWATELGHQTNLKPYGNPSHDSQFGGQIAITEAVDYLIAAGVDPQKISVGWAGYTRNGKGAEIKSFSPLQGSYNRQYSDRVVGSFESGTTEYNDVLYNYLDLENETGRNGFELYTDEVADADFLYNQNSKIFMSLDTPRTVRDKGRYATEKRLGGFFTWTIDQDKGVLVNAAREGCGYQLTPGGEKIDMEPLYFKGINADTSANLSVRIVPQAWSFREGGAVTLRAEVAPLSSGLHYLWKLPAPLHTLDGVEGRELTFGVLPGLTQKQSFTVELTVTDASGKEYSAQASGSVTPNEPPDLEIARIEPSTGLRLKAGEAGSLALTYSPPDGIVDFKWQLPAGLGATSSLDQRTIHFVADEGVTQTTELLVKLVATDRRGHKHEFSSNVTVQSDTQVERPFQVWIDPDNVALQAGDKGTLTVATSGGNGALSYQWKRLPYGLTALSALNQKALTFRLSEHIDEATQFEVSVTVTEPSRDAHRATAVIHALPKKAEEIKSHLVIEPPSLQVSPGQRYSMVASVVGPARILTYSWTLPTGLKALRQGKETEFEVNAQALPGVLSVRVKATDSAGNVYEANAPVTVVHETKPVDDLKLSILPVNLSVHAGKTAQAMAVIGKVGAYVDDFTFDWLLPPELKMPSNPMPHSSVLVFEAAGNVSSPVGVTLKVLAKDRTGQVKGEATTIVTVRPNQTDQEAPPWSPGREYPGGSVVSHNGVKWRAKYTTVAGDEPGKPHGRWGGPNPWERA